MQLFCNTKTRVCIYIFFFFTHHHRSRARRYSRRGCENNRRDKTAHKPHLTQISQVSTDAGLKGMEIKFSKKHRRWERIPQNRGGRKEGSTTANKPGVTYVYTKFMCRQCTLVLRGRRKG